MNSHHSSAHLLITSISLCCAAWLLLAATYASAQTPCHLITPSTIVPSGYGVPWNTQLGSNPLLISVSCSTNSATVTLGTGSSLEYIYQSGYEYRNNQWQSIVFEGQNPIGNWMVGNASTTLSRTETELSGSNFIVAYICVWNGSQWKCGCRDQSCTTPLWQVQGFVGDSSPTPTGAWPSISGMNLAWSWTPKAGDEGKSGEAAGYWIVPPYPGIIAKQGDAYLEQLGGTWTAGGKYKIAKAPDGTLAFEILAPKGQHSISNIRPVLWPNDINKSPSVMRLRYRIYFQTNFDAAMADSSGQKLPGGMIMGPAARAGNYPFSKAGESCPGARDFKSYMDRSASMRLTRGGSSRQFALYVYHVPNPGDDCPFRSTIRVGPVMPVGKWLNLELEFKNQSTKGVADGYVKFWLDGTLVYDFKNMLWMPPHISPQAFRGPWFNIYSGGAPVPFSQDSRVWLRDIEVWTK